MKKVLSMVLALALVLTTLVVPMTVSAATGDAITISYELVETDTMGTIYPGETVTVKVLATAAAKISATYELYIPYPAAMTLAEKTVTDSGCVKIVSETAKDIETVATEVGSYTFTVPASGIGSHSIAAITAANDSYFVNIADNDEIFPTAEVFPITVVPCDATVTVAVDDPAAEVKTEGTTITATSSDVKDVTVTVESDSSDIIEFKVNGDEKTNGEVAFSAFGTYQITFKTAADNKEHSYTVIYKSSVLADVVITGSVTSAQPGEPVAVDVKVQNLGTNKVEVLTFDLVYETDIFTLVETDAYEVDQDNKVTFQAAEGAGVANDTTVLTLNFTVNEDAKVVGVQDIKIENEALAVDRDFAAEPELINSANPDVVAVNVYSKNAVTLGAVTPGYDVSKEISVTQTADWIVADGSALAVKYMNYTTEQPETTTAEMIFTAAAERESVLGGNVTVNTEDFYYVVAQFGKDGNCVYVILEDYTPAQLEIDCTAPVIEMTAWGEAWKNAEALEDGIEFTVTDAGAGVEELSYVFDEENKGTVDVVDGKAYVPVVIGKVYESITVSAVDTLGNGPVEETESIKYDDVDPVITLQNGVYTNGKVPITVTVTATEADAADIPATVEIKLAEDVKEPAYALSNGTATYNAETDGSYTFTVVDRAGNRVSATSEEVDVDKKSVLNAPKFAVLKDTETSDKSLKNNDELAALGVTTNGTFTYLKVFAGEDIKGSITEYTLTKGTDVVAGWTPETALDGANADDRGGYVLTVKTSIELAPTDYQEASYTFSITDRAGFVTVNGDNKYRLTDWMIMGPMDGTGANFKDAVSANYEGGYFSGDVDGDLAEDWFADRTEMLNKIKGAGNWRNYDFAIYNGLDAIQ